MQVSPARSSIKVDLATQAKVEEALESRQPHAIGHQLGGQLFESCALKTPMSSFKAKDTVQRSLNKDLANPDYVVALNLIPRTPTLAGQQ